MPCIVAAGERRVGTLHAQMHVWQMNFSRHCASARPAARPASQRILKTIADAEGRDHLGAAKSSTASITGARAAMRRRAGNRHRGNAGTTTRSGTLRQARSRRARRGQPASFAQIRARRLSGTTRDADHGAALTLSGNAETRRAAKGTIFVVVPGRILLWRLPALRPPLRRARR